MAETAITETGLIHIVDDDAGVRESLGFLLETAGFSVRSHARRPWRRRIPAA